MERDIINNINTENEYNEVNGNIDLITGNPKIAIRKLAWPMMVATFLTMAYNLVDGVWIAGLGTQALAALGYVTPLFMIVVGLGTGLAAGANSLIARYIGANDKEKADNAAIHSILVTIAISLIISVVLTIFLQNILSLMGITDMVVNNYSLDYGYIIFAGTFTFLFSNLGAGILRAEGDVNRGMYALVITVVLNIILDPILIYTFNLKMAGAAWATLLSALISCIVIVYWLFVQKSTYLSFSRKDFNYCSKKVTNLLAVGLSASSDVIIVSILAMILNFILAMVSGSYGVAVYSAGHRIFLMTLIPHIGLGTAVLTVVGVAYGSRNIENLKTGFNYAMKLGIIASIVISIVLFIFAEQIAMMFAYSSTSANLIPGIALFTRVIILYVISIPIGLIPTFSFQGLGKGLYSFITILLRSFIFILIFAYLLTMIIPMNELGVWLALAIGGWIGAILSFIFVKVYFKELTKVFS
jgi:putative MATE family efflux protein